MRGRRRIVSIAATMAPLVSTAVYGGPAAAGDPNPSVDTFAYTSNMELPGSPGQGSDLSIVKTGPSGRQPTGRNMTYNLTVTNNGPDQAMEVVVNDWLPDTVTFVSATPSQGWCGVHIAGLVTCHPETLDNGATATISIVVKPTQAGLITNTATVSTSTPDPESGNDSSSVNTSICRITSRRSSIPCG